ncbi:MAG: hypothetical protein KIT14_18385 [bacterium]|nr:hypothetical protein [bacterium]
MKIVAVVPGILLALLVVPVSSQAQLTKDELKCQVLGAATLGQYVGVVQSCVIKCAVGARKGKNPASDCLPPYAGSTARCIDQPGVGAEDRAIAKFARGCVKGCPPCYQGGQCNAVAVARVLDASVQIDSVIPVIFCDDGGSPDGLSKLEAKCQDNALKQVAKFGSKKLKCFSKCENDEFRGSLPPGSCLPPAPADPRTATCIASAEGRATAVINRACTPPKGDAPECWGSSVDGAFLVAGFEAWVDDLVPHQFCGGASPSGAFLD